MNLPFEIGDNITFHQIKRTRNLNIFPAEVTYEAIPITGTILNIRDTAIDKLSLRTVKDNNIDRSRYLITIKAPTKIHRVYDGCMVNITINPLNDVMKILKNC
jgi:hypothetical protein